MSYSQIGLQKMKVLVTGGLGGIGRHLSYMLLRTGFDVTIMQRYPTQSIKYAKWFPNNRVVWGDVKDFANFKDLFAQQDAIIHLAYALPPATEKNPEATRKTNVDGTRNLVQILEAVNPKCRFLFPSSATIYDPMSNPDRLITINDIPKPSSNYTRNKVECEEIVKASRLPWVILRIAEAPYLEVTPTPKYLRLAYAIRWTQRVEFVHIYDVAIAFKHALTADCCKNTYIIAGGPKCRMTYGDQLTAIFKLFHLPPPPKEKFARNPYPLGWYDTMSAQEVLRYQTRSFDDYLADIKKNLGPKRILFWMGSPITRLVVKYMKTS